MPERRKLQKQKGRSAEHLSYRSNYLKDRKAKVFKALHTHRHILLSLIAMGRI